MANKKNSKDENGNKPKEQGKKREKKQPERKVFIHNMFVGDQIGKKKF